WIRDYHIDGLRLDAVHTIVDDSPLNILEQLATEVHAASAALRRSVLLFAETEANDPRLVRARDAGGYGLDAAWADDWHHALHVAFVPGRGVGGEHALPLLHRPRRSGVGQGRVGRTAARIRRFRLEPRRGAGPARPGHIRGVEAEMGGTGRALPSTHARLVP